MFVLRGSQRRNEKHTPNPGIRFSHKKKIEKRNNRGDDLFFSRLRLPNESSNPKDNEVDGKTNKIE